MEETLLGNRALPMNARQTSAALEASRGMTRAQKSLREGFTEEVALQGVRDARRRLDEVLGGGDPETLYDRIFSRFCLGK
jgi:tRNA U34 5-carboxymethylaminomethyl modifying GTPase MnmE/TrmE